ncbi:uncharacterized protein B0T15DRAFT_526797 [Chaetomium strumarium]|uniref:DUF1330 domain-containing protein n=1 Tax=Chaetomium strumarium TaxID=1170767 RepID=A0AAJ0GUF2_9PEZI|nr:hypothetical protein B0T15DRAFT_526797 [Chaetomium strumarium]
MVVCHLHIVSLKPGVSVASFLHNLRQNGAKPVFQARVLRWMILPRKMSTGHLLGRNIHWDVLLGLEGDGSIPASSQADIAAIWTASSGVSARALSGYGELNATLLNPLRGSVQPAELPDHSSSTSDSSENLELSPEWVQWIEALPWSVREHPVSMLNLLAFHPCKKDQYKQYGAEFSKRAGSRHGGHVKLVGRVLGSQAGADGWEEIAYVHYPSVRHFAAMAGSEDYQAVNKQYRLGALKDTFILCCQEINSDGELAGAAEPGKSKLQGSAVNIRKTNKIIVHTLIH